MILKLAATVVPLCRVVSSRAFLDVAASLRAWFGLTKHSARRPWTTKGEGREDSVAGNVFTVSRGYSRFSWKDCPNLRCRMSSLGDEMLGAFFKRILVGGMFRS